MEKKSVYAWQENGVAKYALLLSPRVCGPNRERKSLEG